MSIPVGIEKRRHPRVDHSVPIKIGTPSAVIVAETRNISCSGAYCRVSEYIEPMTKLSLTLLLPSGKPGRRTSRKIVCGGVVVRVENVPFEDAFNVAVFFNDIRPQDSRALADYVASALPPPHTPAGG